jgi:hypothetical protein
MIASSCNLSYYGDPTGNNFKYSYPNATPAGNALWVFCSWPSSNVAGPTISDNVNPGNWPAAKIILTGGTGKQSVGFFLLTGSLASPAGTTITVTATFTAPVALFQWDIGEHNNITGYANGVSAVVAGPTLATGSFTPPNNNANGGNLVISYFSNSVQATTQAGPNPWVVGTGATLLEADATGLWGGTNSGGFNHALQYDLQTTSAAINPGMTATTDTIYSYNCLAVALTVGTAGSPPSATAIYIAKILHQSIPALTGAGDTTATSAAMQVPWTGNLRFCYGVTDNTVFAGFTDSDGYTWTNWAQDWPNTNAPEGSALWGYVQNTVADTNATFTVATTGGFNGYNSFAFYDIVNAAAVAFDNFQGVSNVPNIAGVSIISGCPIITPFVNKGLMIAGSGLGDGPGLSVTSPSGAVFDYIGYTGQSDGSNYDNSNVCAHIYFNSSAKQTWSWTLTANGDNSLGSPSAITFASADATERVWWIGDGAYTSSTGGASVTLPYPSGIVAGDTLIAAIATQTSAATGGGVVTPSGWTFVGSGPNCHDTTNNYWNQVYLFTQTFASGSSQVFAPLSTANLDGIVRAYRSLTGSPTVNAFASSKAATTSGTVTTTTMPTIIEKYQPGETAVYAAINSNNQITGWDTSIADVNGGGHGVGGGSNVIVLSDYNWDFQPGQIVFTGGGGYGSSAVGVTLAPYVAAPAAGTSGGTASAVVAKMRDVNVDIHGWYNLDALPIIDWFDYDLQVVSVAIFAHSFGIIVGF